MSPPSKNSHHKKYDLFGYLFGFRQLVTRAGYLATGSALMLVKYVTEAIVIWTTTGRVFTPADFLNPLLVYRQQFFEPPAPAWLLGAVLAWTLPFLWILVSMSVRRAWHAGWHGITGMLVLIPILNYAVILALCLVPGKQDDPITQLDPFRTGQKFPDGAAHIWRSALLGVTAGIVLSLVTIFLSVFVLREYGGMLFFGEPGFDTIGRHRMRTGGCHGGD